MHPDLRRAAGGRRGVLRALGASELGRSARPPDVAAQPPAAHASGPRCSAGAQFFKAILVAAHLYFSRFKSRCASKRPAEGRPQAGPRAASQPPDPPKILEKKSFTKLTFFGTKFLQSFCKFIDCLRRDAKIWSTFFHTPFRTI